MGALSLQSTFWSKETLSKNTPNPTDFPRRLTGQNQVPCSSLNKDDGTLWSPLGRLSVLAVNVAELQERRLLASHVLWLKLGCLSATCPGAHYRKHNHRCHRLLRELTYPEVPSLCDLSAMPSGTRILSFFSVVLSMWEFLVRLVFCCTSKHQICISDLHFLTAFQWGTFLQWEGRERGKEAKGILLGLPFCSRSDSVSRNLGLHLAMPELAVR